MGIKNFRFNVIIRVVALAATIFALFYIFEMQDYYITPILFGLIIIIQLFALIHYLEKTNRDLTNFLESIRFSDFSRSFQVEGLGQSFDELKNAFNSVINDFQKIRTEKEEHYFYLQNIIQHIGVSIIAYQKNGNVEMINNAAKKLFQIKSLKNLKQLEGWNKELVDTLLAMKPAENKQVKVQDEDDLLQLSIYSTEFKLDDKSIILVSIKNIQAELEEQEMEAWQKLIRVLTHEIMNSIAPIASLTSTANLLVSDVSESIQKKLSHDFEKETIDDIKNALNTIHKRSTGLIHFVETYRNLTRIPQPNFANFKIKSLFERLINLHTDIFKARRISFAVTISPDELELIADDIQNGKIDGEIKIYDNNNKLIMCYWNLEVDEIRLQQESYFDKSILTDITAKIKKGIFKSNNFNLTFKNFYNPLDVLDIIDVYDLNDISNSILRGNKIGNIITKNDKGYDQIEWKLNLIEENCKSISDCIILNEFKKYN